MQTYENSWDGSKSPSRLCNIDTSTLDLEEGRVEMKIKVHNDGNYKSSDARWHVRRCRLEDLRDFLAGLTVQPAGKSRRLPDGSADEVAVKILVNVSKEKDQRTLKYKKVAFDEYLEDLHTDYILWTEDGGYDNNELTLLQDSLGDEDCLSSADIFDLLLDAPHVMGMNIDGFCTLFKRNLPFGFFKGLEAFQELSKCCDTRLTE